MQSYAGASDGQNLLSEQTDSIVEFWYGKP